MRFSMRGLRALPQRSGSSTPPSTTCANCTGSSVRCAEKPGKRRGDRWEGGLIRRPSQASFRTCAPPSNASPRIQRQPHHRRSKIAARHLTPQDRLERRCHFLGKEPAFAVVRPLTADILQARRPDRFRAVGENRARCGDGANVGPRLAVLAAQRVDQLVVGPLVLDCGGVVTLTHRGRAELTRAGARSVSTRGAWQWLLGACRGRARSESVLDAATVLSTS